VITKTDIVVLIVDDDPTVGRELRSMFEMQGVRVVATTEANRTLELLQSERVDLVVANDTTLKTDCIDLLETIRDRWPQALRIIRATVPSTDFLLRAINRAGVHKMFLETDGPDDIYKHICEMLEERCSLPVENNAVDRSASLIQSVKPPPSVGRVLVIDDEREVCRFFQRALSRTGYIVVTETDAKKALRQFRSHPFEVVISDVSMPDLDGITVLKKVRELDLDTPVILVTGLPSMTSAVEAVQLGAFRYLAKPVQVAELCNTVEQAVQMRRLAEVRRQLLNNLGDAANQISDRAGLEVRFEKALTGLYMVYQPIVQWSTRSVFGYEALVRSQEPSLPHPSALFDAAERLCRLSDIGTAIRLSAASDYGNQSREPLLFINLHPSDLQDENIYDADTPLGKFARHTVLEITERARLEQLPDAASKILQLRKLGYRIALDDIGAGYAGLASFALLEPDIVKLDMALVRNLDRAPTKQRLIRSLMEVCRDFGMQVVAEGIETGAERDALLELGCNLLQGYLFARPNRPFPEPQFNSEKQAFAI
jgi:EAL domain-containing protein (putative c-di-GMP-specific phosphodiesterase class I)/ActR/RegA family two-component response regulator